MTMAAGNRILLSDLVPLETYLASNLTVIPTSYGSIGISRAVTSQSTASTWEVTLDVGYQQGAASDVTIALYVNGNAAQGVMRMFGLATNFLAPFSRTWVVTGLAAGTVTLDPRIVATVANSCVLFANNTHMLVKQCA